MIHGAEIAARARAWVGTPYAHQAALKGIGCDCIGLIAGVADEVGLPEARAWRSDVRFRGYAPQPLPDKLLEACAAYLDAIPRCAAKDGDVLLFLIGKQPAHFGIVSSLAPLRMVHAWSPNRRVVEHGIDAKWHRRINRAFRLRGVD